MKGVQCGFDAIFHHLLTIQRNWSVKIHQVKTSYKNLALSEYDLTDHLVLTKAIFLIFIIIYFIKSQTLE